MDLQTREQMESVVVKIFGDLGPAPLLARGWPKHWREGSQGPATTDEGTKP